MPTGPCSGRRAHGRQPTSENICLQTGSPVARICRSSPPEEQNPLPERRLECDAACDHLPIGKILHPLRCLRFWRRLRGVTTRRHRRTIGKQRGAQDRTADRDESKGSPQALDQHPQTRSNRHRTGICHIGHTDSLLAVAQQQPLLLLGHGREIVDMKLAMVTKPAAGIASHGVPIALTRLRNGRYEILAHGRLAVGLQMILRNERGAPSFSVIRRVFRCLLL